MSHGCFFDIDGTIVDNATQVIPHSAIRAVERLRERGHIPIVNTGRPFAHTDPRVRDMAFSGWVCGCGMDELKARAEFVTDTVLNNGIEKALEHYQLI